MTTISETLPQDLAPRRRGRRPSPDIAERDAKIVAQFNEGRTQVELSREFGISKQRVAQVLHRRGAEAGPHVTAARRAARRAATDAEVEARRAELVTRGLEYVRQHPDAERGEVLEALEPHRDDISFIAQRLDITGPQSTRDDHIATRDAEVRRRFLAGEDTAEIAADLDLDVRTVRRLTAVAPDEVTATGPRARRPRQWTNPEIVDYVAQFRAAGTTNSMKAYKAWAAEVEGAPSLETVVARMGGWNAAKRAALLRDLKKVSRTRSSKKTA